MASRLTLAEKLKGLEDPRTPTEKALEEDTD